MVFKKKIVPSKRKDLDEEQKCIVVFCILLTLQYLFPSFLTPFKCHKSCQVFLDVLWGNFFFKILFVCLFVCFSLKMMSMLFANSRCIIRVLHLRISNSWISPCATKSSNMHDMKNFHFLDIPQFFPNLDTYIIEVQN